ncbi:cytochrome P450 [Pseudonocardia sp. HH130630-07]|uniref:cytochrome P450 n=1 Tax=Pseudonocardia sp. HH130630-07 TaxID=1690815 RepID=UPI000814FFE6|nr:cytochrome P450 [Pseudonocardia sp. HH130630-07]ANY08164.1 cytochrome [Pseudonocardia sp. HH130630-07]
MTTPGTGTDLPRLPFPREDVLALPPLFDALRERSPVTPVRTPAGDVAWLVTGYAEARALFADDRLGRSHPDPDRAARISGSMVFGGPSGESPEAERENHSAMRRLLAPAFSARRMRSLSGHVADLVAGRLDALEAAGPGADLHEIVSFPLPVLVICELLGVPFDDRARFGAWSEGLGRLDDRAHAEASAEQLFGYVRALLDRKAADPGEDVLSDFAAIAGGDGGQRDRLAGLGAALLFAGHETTVGRIDLGTVLLLERPGEWGALAADPDRAPGAVEEILRLAAPGSTGIPRYAQADIDVAGVHIPAGDAILLAPGAANRDPRTFDDPQDFDPARGPGRLAFGHGPYFCVGATLARVELTEVFRALPARFPGLRLAVPRSELTLRSDVLTGGLRAVPVTWDAG